MTEQAPVDGTSGETPAPRASGQQVTIPLHRNRDFHLLWTGSATAFLGLFTAEIAFPLTILAISGSPGLASLFAVTQTTAAIVCGLPAGQFLDRHDRRLALIVTEMARAVLVGSLVGAFLVDRLTVAHLLTVAALLGAVQRLGSARMLLLRAAVAPEQLTSAVTVEEVRTNTAELSGPPLGGFLYGIAHVLPFVFATAMLLLSAAIAAFLRVPTTPVTSSDGRQGMFTGLSTILREGTLRAIILVIILLNGVAWSTQFTVVVMLQARGIPPWQIGLTVTGFAVGGLVGTTLVKRLHAQMRPGILLVSVVLFEVPVLSALPAPLPVWWTGLMCVFFGLGLPAIRVLIDVLIIRQIPDEQRGRALSGATTLFTLSVPVAMLGTGILLQAFRPAISLLFLAALLLAAVLYAQTRTTLRHAQWPPAATESA